MKKRTKKEETTYSKLNTSTENNRINESIQVRVMEKEREKMRQNTEYAADTASSFELHTHSNWKKEIKIVDVAVNSLFFGFRLFRFGQWHIARYL